MTQQAVGGLLTTAGTLLAAFGFYYTRVADELSAALAQSKPSDPANREELRRRSVEVLWRAAVPLFVGAVVVVLVLSGGAVAVLRDAAYHPLRLSGPSAGLVLLTAFWVVVFAYFLWACCKLTGRWATWRA